jgi:hypothetical protein
MITMCTKAFLIFWTIFQLVGPVFLRGGSPGISDAFAVLINIAIWSAVAVPVLLIGLLCKSDTKPPSYQGAVYFGAAAAALLICGLMHTYTPPKQQLQQQTYACKSYYPTGACRYSNGDQR